MTLGTHGPARAAAALLASAAVLVLGPRLLDRAARPIPGVEARISGQFAAGGDVPLNRGIAADGVRWDGFPRAVGPAAGGRFWSSWGGSNGNQGEVVLGPFPAPRVLGISVCGYPHLQGNHLYLEDAATAARWDITEDNIGASWTEIREALPASWWGRQVVLHAVDGSAAPYGWLAVGEPRSAPRVTAWWGPFARKLLGFAATCLVLLLLQAAALSLLRDRREIPPGLLPLASFALVALAGYAAFWVFLASAPAGKVVAWIVLAGSAWKFVRASGAAADVPAVPGSRTPVLLMVAIGALYFGVLLLHGSDRSLSDTASRRFIDNLAVDNDLPQMFADRLSHGEDPRHLAFGWWSSSDRPPLQAGCDLLLACPTEAAGVDPDTAAQSAGIWMQLLWVCAAWAWLGALGVSGRRSALIIAVLAPTGFLLLNSVYVWPKLMAGAFTVGAFCVWLAMRSGLRDGPRDFVLLSLLASLGLLAQTGAAFSILAWLPLAACRLRRVPVRSWAAAAAVCAVLVLPWMAYQRYYNPPANLLLKWHLGGANVPDGRGTWETIRSGYASLALPTLLRYRLTNFAVLFRGPWLERMLYRATDLEGQRNGEYYGVFFALGRWNVGFVPLCALLFSAWRVRFLRETVSRLGLSVGWCLLTLAVWLALMFLPESTVIHQGSYACVLLLLLTLALALWMTWPALFALVAVLGAVDFVRIWLPANPGRPAPAHAGAEVLILVSCLAIAVIVRSAGRRPAVPIH